MKKIVTGENASPLVYVLVLNYKGIPHLDECMGSLLDMDYGNFKVVMVDNASTDGSRDYVRANFPDVEIVQNERNEQFAKGMNVGMRYVLGRKAEYIALLNNDILAERLWLTEMVNAISSAPDIGAVVSRLMYYGNRKILNGIGVDVTRLAYAIDRGQGEIFKEKYRRSEEVIAFTGGACLLRSEALKNIGLFDPFFVAYFEDVDLSLRLAASGWRIVTAPDAVIYHKHSASWGLRPFRQQYMILRNRLMIMMKYFPVEELFKNVLLKHLNEQLWLFNERLRRRDWRFAGNQIIAHLSILRFVLRALRFRLDNRGKLGYRLYEKLAPKYNPAALPYPRWDYSRPSEGCELPDRIIFGITDEILGDGWLPLDCEHFPQYRWMCNEAECFLKAEKDSESILQIHVRQPFKMGESQVLSVFMNGELIGKVEVPHGGWHTYQLACVPFTEEVKVSFTLDRYIPADPPSGRYDLGLQFNEVSLLPEGSSFARQRVMPDGVS